MKRQFKLYRRSVTLEEHQLLVSAEKNDERRAFLELLWHVGAAQIDLVTLKAEGVDWKNRTISYNRQRTGRLCTLRFGDEVAEIFKRLPTRGPLFPKYSTLSSADRATRFAERVERLGIRKRSKEAGIPSICLHSYRYSWAERARAAGYPERYAQETLGHQSSSFARIRFKRSIRCLIISITSFANKATSCFWGSPMSRWRSWCGFISAGCAGVRKDNPTLMRHQRSSFVCQQGRHNSHHRSTPFPPGYEPSRFDDDDPHRN